MKALVSSGLVIFLFFCYVYFANNPSLGAGYSLVRIDSSVWIAGSKEINSTGDFTRDRSLSEGPYITKIGLTDRYIFGLTEKLGNVYPEISDQSYGYFIRDKRTGKSEYAMDKKSFQDKCQEYKMKVPCKEITDVNIFNFQYIGRVLLNIDRFRP